MSAVLAAWLLVDAPWAEDEDLQGEEQTIYHYLLERRQNECDFIIDQILTWMHLNGDGCCGGGGSSLVSQRRPF